MGGFSRNPTAKYSPPGREIRANPKPSGRARHPRYISACRGGSIQTPISQIGLKKTDLANGIEVGPYKREEQAGV